MASHPVLLLPALLAVTLQSQSSLLHPSQPLCSATGNYTDGTQYEKNLHELLSTLSRAARSNGWFKTSTVGIGADQVFGLIMWYADHDEAQCLDCLALARPGITAVCRGSRSVSANYAGCLLRYSDIRFFGVADVSYTSEPDLPSDLPRPDAGVKNITSLADARSQLMAELAGSAGDMALNINTYSLPYMDARFGTDVITGLAQCTRDLASTRDLAPSECKRCISNYTELVPGIFANRSGGAMKGFSCYLRYQLEPFDITLPHDVPAQPPSMSPIKISGAGGN